METNLKTREKYRIYMALATIGCTLLNVAFAYLAYRFKLPMYLDTIGTIFISMLGGAFPGVITAVATNLICSPAFNPDAMFFTLISVLVAICSSYYVKKDLHKKSNIILLALTIGVISGSLGTIFQWMLFKGPQFDYVAELAVYFSGNRNDTSFFIWSLGLIIALNIVDKGISVLISALAFHFIPENVRQSFFNCSFRQTPLKAEDLKKANAKKEKGKESIRLRLSFLLLSASFAITLVLGFLSIKMNYDASVDDGRKTVANAASFAAELIDADQIQNYLRSGKTAPNCDLPGYKETNDLLCKLKDSYTDLEYIYVYQIREDACYAVFDTDDYFQEGGQIGERIEFDESYLPLVPALLKGERIEVQEAESRFGYLLTAYEPLYNSNGKCVAYVGADISFSRISDYLKNFVVRALLIFSGFFALIVAFGIWMSGNFIIYPISALEKYIDGFMRGIEDQKKIDKSVRKLDKLDICTNDEVENLYRSVCEMAKGTADQMRSIRLLARSNEKMQRGLIITMADLVESRDKDTGAHIQKTAAYVRIILKGLKEKGYYADRITDKYANDVEKSAPLHDIGKINVPDAVLNKPGKLTDEEYEIMKTHTTAGRKILENAISTVEGENYLKEARNMAAYHHERWDGKGYPEGLSGKVIPLSARIMAVADVFDALTSPRVYKPGFPLEKALEIIKDGSGKQFDPLIVEVFLDSVPEIKKTMQKYQIG
jgi:HD-GYP domain-containing protein (c-di-GMP phosphodiesterase class II)